MMGNCKVERAKLSPGFIPMGMKEYGGIIYIASYNVDTKQCEIGSFPSPERDITGSTKISNQTGLQDGHFFTSDYSIPIVRGAKDAFEPELLTSKIQKLNEESVLMLNPGDKFITTYQVNTADGEVGQEVVTDTNFFEFFNTSNLDKKLFSINFYKIDAGNNVVKIPNNEVRTIQHRTDIEEDEYIYYTQSSSGNIAVGVEMNSLLYFSAAARETSKLKDSNKSIRIEAVGESDSSINFKGIRVDLTKNNTELETFHVENQGVGDKVAVNVTDFEQNDEVKCDITPYSDYGYLSNLLQSFNLKMGQGVSGQQINNIFKWRVDTNANRLELDFDFLLETENTFKLFIEFYDPWSNVSTIRNVPAPSIYGPMRLVMSLVDEPKTSVFDVYPDTGVALPTNQKGGISFSKLAVSNNDITLPILINPATSDNKLLIRTDNALRKNHFYIVRVCGYEEEVGGNGEILRTYNDAYRALYTNDIYNELYEAQSNMDPTSNSYKPIFTDEAYPLEKLKYLMNRESSTNVVYTKLATDPIPDDTILPKTTIGDKAYAFNVAKAPTGTYSVLNTKWKGEQDYSINLVKPDQYIYGSLKNNLLVVKTSNTEVPIATSSIDDLPDLNERVSMDTTAKIIIPTIDSGTTKHILKLNFETNRPIQGNFVKQTVQGAFTKKTLADLYHYPGDVGFQGCAQRMPASHYYYRVIWKDKGTPCNGDKSGLTTYMTPYDQKIIQGIHQVKSKTEGESDVTESNAPQTLLDSVASGKYIFSIGLGGYLDNLQDRILLVVVDNDNRMFGFPIATTRTGNHLSMSTIRDTLAKFYYYEMNMDIQSTRYYVSNNLLFFGETDTSKLINMSVDLVSGWNPVAAKTYIYNSYFRGLTGTDGEFNTLNVNTLIANAKARAPLNNVVEGAEELDDSKNFIPYITPTSDIDDSVFKLSLNDVNINLGPDKVLYDLFNESEEQYFSYPMPEADMSTKNVYTDSQEPQHKSFARFIKYNPNIDVNRLEVDRNAISGKIHILGFNYTSRSTQLKLIDAVSDTNYTFS